MVTRDRDHLAIATGRWQAEAVALALHHQDREIDSIQLLQPVLSGLPRACRRLERKREAEDGHRADLIGGAAGHASPERAASDDQRESTELIPPQVLEHGDPCRVELPCRSGGASAGYAIRLLDERDAEADGPRGLGGRQQVGSLNASARPVTEDDGRAGLVRGMQMGAGSTRGRLDLEWLQRADSMTLEASGIRVRALATRFSAARLPMATQVFWPAALM